MIDTVLQRALKVRKRLCRAAEAHAFADVVASLTAALALSAGYADLEGDLVADAEARGCGADGHDHTGGLVAEREGLADDDIAVAVVVVVVQVGAAETCRADGDLEFRRAWGLESACFLAPFSMCFL